MASERLALRRFRHVYGMCVWLPATHLEPGAVEAQGAPMSGLLHVGRYPSGTDETIERVGADLAASRFLAPVVPDIMRWKHGKLLANLANAIEAVCGQADDDGSKELRAGCGPRAGRCSTRPASPTPATRRTPGSGPTRCRSSRSMEPNGVAARHGRA